MDRLTSEHLIWKDIEGSGHDQIWGNTFSALAWRNWEKSQKFLILVINQLDAQNLVLW